MPILYPSRSPINPARLRRIIPWRPSRTNLLIHGLIPVTLTIIAFELLNVVGFNLVEFDIIISIITLLAAVIYTSSRHGTFAGIVSSIPASIYLAYVVSPNPLQPFMLDPDLTRSLVLISALYVGLAAVTGYLREQIQRSFIQEKITRALAEEQQFRLEAILEQLPIGVVITDSSSETIIYVNQVGRNLLSSALKDHPKRISEDHLIQVLGSVNKTKPSTKESFYLKPDGQPLHLQISTSPIYDLSGEHVSTVSTFFDITQQKETEQRKDDFIGIASHELKTPVTSLKIYMQLLQRHRQVEANSELGEIISKANNQITKLTGLMSDLLDVSRVQTGITDYSFKESNINHVVKEVIKTISPSTHHRLKLSGSIKDSVYMDAEKITQVLTNLVNNAVKYSAGAEEIQIQLSQDDQFAYITVKDFGIGIARSQQKKIFDRFYQVRQKGKKTFPGLGIGLFISQRIVTDHRGQLTVSSELNQGSTFTVKLPLYQPEG